VGTIAHVLEGAGLCTVALGLIRGQAERLRPPRMLYCPFPLGRPLGKPGDAVFQRRVLDAAFALLAEHTGPVLVDFPEAVEDASGQPLSCPLPPRENLDLEPAVEEALGLRPAYERNRRAAGRTLVGRAVDADGVPRAVEAFVRIGEGKPWKEVGLDGHPLQWARDITSYYEEAAAALVAHVPAARSAESWLYGKTETGKVLKRARARLKEAGEPFWFYLVPFTQDL